LKPNSLAISLLLVMTILITLGCSSQENNMPEEIASKEAEKTNASIKSTEQHQPATVEAITIEQKDFAKEYPDTMEQCMFIDSAEIVLDKSDQVIRATIIIKEEITEDLLNFRMEQHLSKLTEEFPNQKVEIKAIYHDDSVGALATADKENGQQINVNVK